MELQIYILIKNNQMQKKLKKIVIYVVLKYWNMNWMHIKNIVNSISLGLLIYLI